MRFLGGKCQLLTATETNNTDQPLDCSDILRRNPAAESGLYTIYPLGQPHSAFCDMETDRGGWTVRQLYMSRLSVKSYQLFVV